MTWRPWVIATLGVVAVLINVALMWLEDMPSVTRGPEVSKFLEPLKPLSYAASNRRQNLETMGLPAEVADLAANRAAALERDRKKWQQILIDGAPTLSGAICAGELPQPYAMMRFLVYEDAGTRYAIEAERTLQLEPQPWYEASVVPALYNHFERTERRKADATVMAVSAALLAMEGDALDGRSPWSMGALGAWSYGRLETQHPRLRAVVVKYFGLMHYLVELAHDPAGGPSAICL